MDNYNVLVLMQRDKQTNMLTETVDSYTISEDMKLIEGIYLMMEEEPYVYLTFTTEDVEEWQYYGIYDLYNEEIFDDQVEELLDGSGEYNPRWILKFKYMEDRLDMEDKINHLIRLHEGEIKRVMPLIEESKEKYQKEAENEE